MNPNSQNVTNTNLESNMLKKLQFKSVSDVSVHELNALKDNRIVYLKKGNVYFLSNKEEALHAVEGKKSETK